MLSNYQRILFGFMQSCNIAGLLDTVALFYYNNELGVSTSFLGISSVIVGCFAAYITGKSRFRGRTFYI
jgi:sugar phosphate permease